MRKGNNMLDTLTALLSVEKGKWVLSRDIQCISENISRSTVIKWCNFLVQEGLAEKKILERTQHKTRPTHLYRIKPESFDELKNNWGDL